MSAFIVSPAHINAIVTWASFTRCTPREMAAQGRMLMAENCKSVGARYNESRNADLAAYRFEPDAKRRTPVEIIKACDCLAYQSREHDGWERSDAKRFLDEARERAIRQLPGYSETAWEIQD